MTTNNGYGVRASNFELLRIVAMLMVMVIHATAYGPIGLPTVADGLTQPGLTFARCLTHGFVIVCVNVFVLLSGYFGIRLRTKVVASYMFQTAFWRALSITIICAIYHVSLFDFRGMIPFAAMTVKPLGFTFGAWFIGAYLGLMLISPVLNAFIEKSPTKTLGLYVIGFFVVEMLFDWLLGGLTFFQGGFSLVPLMGLYLCGAWLKRKDCPMAKFTLLSYVSAYLFCAIASGGFMFFALIVGRKLPILAGITGKLFFPFTSVHAIFGSVAFFMIFAKLQFYSKMINWIATSAFAVYLFHGAMPFYKATTMRLYGIGGWFYLLGLVVFIVTIFCVAVLVDKIRALLLWNCISKRFFE